MNAGLLGALACLHDEPHVWCLAGPWSLLTWEVEPASIADLPPMSGDGQPDGTGWTRFTGGFLVQADYAGTLEVVRVRSALLWDAAGALQRIGDPRLPSPRTHRPPRLTGPPQPLR